jgi:hypothetical protein
VCSLRSLLSRIPREERGRASRCLRRGERVESGADRTRPGSMESEVASWRSAIPQELFLPHETILPYEMILPQELTLP